VPQDNQHSFAEWRKTHPPMMGAQEVPEAGPENVQGDAQQQEQQQGAPPPWGEDFNPQRAWDTITAQRESEATLKQQLQESQQVKDLWEAAQNDPELQAQILGLWGYDIEGNEDPGSQQEQAFQDPRVDALLQERQAEQDANLLTGHIQQLAEKEGVALSDGQFQRLFRDAVDAGLNPQGTEQVFKQFVEDRKQEEQAIIDRYVKSKRTPRPASGGVPGSEKVDLSNEEERLKAFAATLESFSNDT
jgi:hypothetical protein